MSTLDAFHRYELKYLVGNEAVPALRAEFARRLDLDEHSDDHGYDVWSVYYDTPRLQFYWDKMDDRPFRRKLRVRLYGDGSDVDADTTVYVEIKQQVNGVTEKRRVSLPYRLARQLCDGREPVGPQPFLAEVLGLVDRLDLRSIAVVAYRREAFVGRPDLPGLRVTLDRWIRGRDRDLLLGVDAPNRPILAGARSILEIKAPGRVPFWLTDLTARNELPIARVSKYCQSVETFGHAPRSALHITDPVGAHR
jgi:hypothetical protein